jgi:glycerophosphoryl diester phosphodiesterase
MGPRAVATVRLGAATGSMPRLGADCIQVPIRQGRVRIVTKRFVEVAHKASLRVHVWTINDETTINELLDLHVDGIMTDRLRVLQGVFASRGLSLDGTPSDRAPGPVD